MAVSQQSTEDLIKKYLDTKTDKTSALVLSDAKAYASCYNWYVTNQKTTEDNAAIAAKVWVQKYALHDTDGFCVESTPNDTWIRLANVLADEEMLTNPNTNFTREYWFSLFLNALTDWKYVPQGSGLFALGNTSVKSSASNCFVLPSPEDTLESIFNTARDMARIYAYRGGCGIDISGLRPFGAKTNNAARTSTGAASFMDFYSQVTNLVGQSGRRGALMLSIRVDHPDVLKFIRMKRDLEKKPFIDACAEAGIDLNDWQWSAIHDRLKSTSFANVSVRLTKKFIEAVKNDEQFELWFEYLDNEYPRYSEMVSAKEIWNELMQGAWESAEPGILNWDHIISESPADCYLNLTDIEFTDPKTGELKTVSYSFQTLSTNPCQPGFATVLTPDGIKTFDDINVGSTIWSGKQWTKVINKVATGVKQVYRYSTNAGDFIGTENHRVVSNSTKIEVGCADSIDVSTGDPVFLQPLSTTGKRTARDLQAIIDGWVIGDGSVHTASNNLVYLCVGRDDSDIHTELSAKLIEHRTGIKPYAWTVDTTIIAAELPKTYERSIPKRYKHSGVDTVADFLRGLYSANGSVVGNRVTLKAASLTLIKDVQEMLSILGICSYVTTNKPHDVTFENGTYTCKQSYDLNIGTIEDKIKFANYVGFVQSYKEGKLNVAISGTPSNRKKTSYDIVSVELLGEMEVFDITVEADEHTYWTGGLLVSNCGEIPLSAGDSCCLGTFYLPSFVKNPYTTNAVFDYEQFSNVVSIGVRAQDNIKNWDAKILPLEINRISAILGRRIALGTHGLADCLAMLGIQYDTEEAIETADAIYGTLKNVTYATSVQLGKEKGVFQAWDWDKEKNNPFLNRLDPKILADMKNNGRRNIACLTNAPTGSISILSRNCSSGIEPVFKKSYNRNVKKPGTDDVEVFTVYHQAVQDCINAGGDPAIFVEAGDIDPTLRVRLQSVIQSHIDHAISVTTNLKAEATKDEVASLYMKAFELGCKGMTVYREGSRTGVLTSIAQPKTKVAKQIERPKTTEVDIHKMKYKDRPWAILIGKVDGKPVEVFAGIEEDTPLPNKYHKAELTKKSRGHYTLTIQLSDDAEDIMRVNNVGARFPAPEGMALSRFTSLALRSGVTVSDIMEQLQKSSSSMFDYPAVLARVLKHYVTEEEYAEKYKGKPCPDCGGELKFRKQDGCLVEFCENASCNYQNSKCG